MLVKDVEVTKLKGNKYLELANNLLIAEKFDEALSYCDQLLEIDNKNVEAWRLKSDIYRDIKQWENALYSIHNAITLSELKEPSDYYDSGKLKLRLHKYEDAIHDYLEIIFLCEKYNDLYYKNMANFFLSYSYLLLKNKTMSMKYLELIDDDCQNYIHEKHITKNYIINELNKLK